MRNLSTVSKLIFTVLFAMMVTGCMTDKQFAVNTQQDLHDLNPGDGICAANAIGNLCSLRAAVEETNQTINTLRVDITIPTGFYSINIGDFKGLSLNRGRVNLVGTGTTSTIIDGSNENRLFTIETSDFFASANAKQIQFKDLTLQNGDATGNQWGGAVFIDSNNYQVTFNKVLIQDSVAGQFGGGIAANGIGVLNILNSTIQRNRSTNMNADCNQGGGVSGGGGILSKSTLNIINSEIRENCGSNGAGIRISAGGNNLILRSTIAENIGPNTGAGIMMVNTDLHIEDSTIAQNRVTASNQIDQSGGIYVLNSDLEIINSTITENQAPLPTPPRGGSEDFIEADGLFASNSDVKLKNTVLANNDNVDCGGLITTEGGNFIGTLTADCDFTSLASDIVNGGNPQLGNLQLNGGTTRTMRPLAGSSLVDAGISGCENIDQRGFDFPAPAGAACDIGAIER